MKAIIKILPFWLLPFLIISCASSPKYEGEAYLTGLVVDENNSPVSDYVIRICANNADTETAVTSDTGIFYFSKIKSGTVIFEGEKNEWTKIKSTIPVNKRDKVYCFQVKSAEAFLDSVNELVRVGELETALKSFDELSYEKKSELGDVVSFYKKTLKEKIKQRRGV